MTEGFGLEVDGCMKRSFPTLAAAQKTKKTESLFSGAIQRQLEPSGSRREI
jgi:hypothetical protein